MIILKRVYEAYDPEDGYRILVDRLWPRGIKKEKAHIDLWLKAIAPTNELRKWYGHEVEKWDQFVQKYTSEINHNTEATAQLREIIQSYNKITLLFGAKDEAHNQAIVLYNWLQEQ